MATTNQVQVVMQNLYDRKAKVKIPVVNTLIDPENALLKGAGSLRTLIEAVCGVQITRVSIGIPKEETDTATAGAFTSNDKAALLFQDAVGAKHKVYVPAPAAAGFVSGSDEVDDTEENMAALILWIKTNAKSANGDALSTYLGGRRVRQRHTTRDVA